MLLVEELTRHLDPCDPMTAVIREDLRQRCADKNPPQTSARLLPAGRGKSHRGWLWLLGVAAFMIFVAAAVVQLLDFRPTLPWLPQWAQEKIQQDSASRISPVAVYNPHLKKGPDGVMQARRAWEARPDSAAAYYLYAYAYSAPSDRMTPDFDEVTQRLDPGNGIWPLMRSRALAMNAFVNRASSADPADPALLGEFTKELKKAADSERLDYHRTERLHLWRESFSPDTVFQTEAFCLDFGQTGPFSFRPEDAMDQGIPWQAEVLEKEPEKLKEFLNIAGRFMAKNVQQGVKAHLLDRLLPIVRRAGLTEEVARLERLKTFSDEAQLSSESERTGTQLGSARKLRGWQYGLLAGAAIFFAGSVVCAVRLIPFPVYPSSIARCLAFAVQRPAIRWWLALLAMGIPALIGLVAAGNVEERPWGIARAVAVIAPMLDILIPVAVSMMVILATGVAWLVSSRIAFAGLQPSFGRVLWTGGMALASIVAVGFFASGAPQTGLFLGGAAVLFFMGKLGAGYAGRNSAIRHLLVARQVLPLTLSISLLMSGASVGLREMERHLVHQLWNQLPSGDDVPAETRLALDALISEWKAESP